jgi:CubicO group peptidase (beta-lactamase class C family)
VHLFGNWIIKKILLNRNINMRYSLNSHIGRITSIILVGIIFNGCNTLNYYYKIPSNEKDGLKSSSIITVGIDSLKLLDLVKDINDEKFINVHSVLISKNNNLVFEEYFNGNTKETKHQLRSAAKSFTSALIGIAIDKKLLKNSDARVLDLFNSYPFIKKWNKRKDRLKVKHLLTMTAGLDCGNIMNANSNCGLKVYQQRDPVKYLLDLPMKHEPGEHFAYHDGITFLLSGIIGNSAKIPASEFKEKYLYSPLGIIKDSITSGISSRGMMKFGLLYLNRGIWNGKRIISREWIDESTSVHVKNPNNYMDGYGYYWWHKTFELDNRAFKTYFAAGNGGQYIFILPEENLVVVLTGGNYVDFDTRPSFKVRSQPYYILVNYILPALLKLS